MIQEIDYDEINRILDVRMESLIGLVEEQFLPHVKAVMGLVASDIIMYQFSLRMKNLENKNG